MHYLLATSVVAVRYVDGASERVNERVRLDERCFKSLVVACCVGSCCCWQ